MMIETKPKKGNLLVAEPLLNSDLPFNRSVILLADHSNKGSVGFILNKPLHYTICDLVPGIVVPLKIYNGGPVEQDNLYFIHNTPNLVPNSIEIAQGIYWGGCFDSIRTQINDGIITQRNIRFFLGYSGWGKQQLQNEVQSKSWIISKNNLQKKILEKSSTHLWKEKIKELGGVYLIWANAPEDPSYN